MSAVTPSSSPIFRDLAVLDTEDGRTREVHLPTGCRRQRASEKIAERRSESSNPSPSSGESSERLDNFGAIGDGDLSILTLLRATPRPATTGEAGGLIRCHRDLAGCGKSRLIVVSLPFIAWGTSVSH